MSELDYLVNEHHIIPYLMLQYKGMAAHSALVAGIEPFYEDFLGKRMLAGYHLKLIDSNYTWEISETTYRLGDRTMGSSSPYSPSFDFDSDLFKIWRVMDRECSSTIAPLAPWKN